jgi:hypothetical protein
LFETVHIDGRIALMPMTEFRCDDGTLLQLTRKELAEMKGISCAK